MENVPCGSEGLSCTKSVKFTIMDTIVHLVRGTQPIVTENPAWPLVNQKAKVHFDEVGVFLIVETPYGE